MADDPWQVVSLDFITGLPATTSGHDAILVAIDKFSKMGHFIPTHTAVRTEETAQLFVRYIISQHGIPTTLISDRDPKFTSKFWKELMSLLGTKIATSSAYHLQTDGQTERLNQTVEQLLRAACKDDISKWDLHLPVLEFAYNNATHSATGQTPFFLCYGRHPLTPQQPTIPATVQSAHDFITTMHKLWDRTHKRLLDIQQQQKRQADRHRTDHTITVGDQVLLDTCNLDISHLPSKLRPCFCGPFLREYPSHNYQSVSISPEVVLFAATFPPEPVMCSSDDEDDGGEDDHSAERFVRVAPLRGLDFLRRAHAAPVYSNPLPSLSSEEWERNQDDVTELVDSPSKAPPATRPATTTPAATRPATSTPAATRPATSTPAATPPATTTSVAVTSKKRHRYEQSHLPFAPPPPKPPTPPPPERVTAPSAKPTVAEKTARAYEKAQHKYTNDWLPKFPWLVLDKNDDGIPCLRCSVCMEHGAVHARYGREGSGGRDLQVGSMRWHQESQKHEDAVRKQQHLLTEVENQKRMEDFVANDPEGARIIRLLRAMLFICKEDAPISMFTRLVGFMAHEGVKDVPKQSYGVYITQYGFKEMVKAMVAFLQAQQMSHIHASPFIGLSCDESTDRTRGKHLILFATFLKKRKVVTEFLALLTVDKCDAASLQAIILSHLETLGVDLQKISGISTDGASVMTGEHHGLVARLRMRIPHLVGVHCIAHRESLAVKDAAAAFPDFKIIDAVIRALGEIVGRSTPWYERFKHLQMVIHNTNLEHQGLYLIRWLSRGDAIKRLCSILGAAIVVLIEYNHKLAPVVKTLKFHYCLYFLADVLAEMNTLNRFFQRRSVSGGFNGTYFCLAYLVALLHSLAMCLTW
ncbi:hypothetical protein CLOM_g20362 [Closterium sp. NIES-68]|nr:hypothetical protein CLOM_g20362 [Closterium sp. NIES-68]